MSEKKNQNKKSIFALILALILGFSGLGIGVFTLVAGPQGEPGIDGQDGQDGQDGEDAPGTENLYYCQSQAEIESAIITIGSGFGKIIITENFAIGEYTLDINGSGSYVIEGAGLVTISTNGLIGIEITDASSVIIRDVIFDGTSLTGASPVINIPGGDSFNSLTIENVYFYGDSDGSGIVCWSDNVTVTNCEFFNFQYGMNFPGQSNIAIIGNKLDRMSQTGIVAGGSGSVISDNIVNHSRRGIYLSDAHETVVSNNLVTEISQYGIYTEGDNSIFTGNLVYSSYDAPNGNIYGFYLDSAADNNILTGNVIAFLTPSIYTGYSMFVLGSENTITGNRIYGNDVNAISDAGTGNLLTGNNVG